MRSHYSAYHRKGDGRVLKDNVSLAQEFEVYLECSGESLEAFAGLQRRASDLEQKSGAQLQDC